MDFGDIKQLIVIVALVTFNGLILISELFFGYRCTDTMIAILNMMVGALIAILSGKAIEFNQNKG